MEHAALVAVARPLALAISGLPLGLWRQPAAALGRPGALQTWSAAIQGRSRAWHLRVPESTRAVGGRPGGQGRRSRPHPSMPAALVRGSCTGLTRAAGRGGCDCPGSTGRQASGACGGLPLALPVLGWPGAGGHGAHDRGGATPRRSVLAGLAFFGSVHCHGQQRPDLPGPVSAALMALLATWPSPAVAACSPAGGSLWPWPWAAGLWLAGLPPHPAGDRLERPSPSSYLLGELLAQADSKPQTNLRVRRDSPWWHPDFP